MAFLNNLLKTRRPEPTVSAVDEPTAPAATGTTGGQRYRLDTYGQVCPFPLVEAKQAMTQLQPGDQLIIDFDCTQATDSIPNWASAQGYPVTNFQQVGEAAWTITVQKA